MASPYQTIAWELSRAVQIVDEFIAMGGRKVTLTGGEPLIYPDLLPLVKEAASGGLEVVIFTSGVIGHDDGLLSSATTKQLTPLSPYVRRLVFSLYGDLSAHDEITKAPGSHEAVLRAVCAARSAGIECQFHFVPVRRNLDRLPEVVDTAIHLGITAIRIIRFVPQGRGSHHACNMTPDEEDMLRLFGEVRRLRKLHPTVDFKIGSAFTRWTREAGRCTAAINELVIDSVGNAYPCSGFSGMTGTFGNVHRAGLGELWHSSEPLHRIRSEVMELRGGAGKTVPTNCELCPAQRAHRNRLQKR